MKADQNTHPEFRISYFTSDYDETVRFYKDQLRWEVYNTWDRGALQRCTIFRSPNGAGLIEVEEGTERPVLQSTVYIQVDDVDDWAERLIKVGVLITDPIADRSYAHRSFYFHDPNGLRIGFFRYIR